MKIQSRRTFVRNVSLGTLGIAGLSSFCLNKTQTKRKPNLLFIWTDEQRSDTMEVYGNKKIKTPNLNKLASQSFVFKKTYVTQAVSTPSRSSVMTGLYPHTNGCTENNIPLKNTTNTFPELLNDKSYKTAYMGKWHLGDEIFAQHGFETWISIEDLYNKFYSEGKDKDARSDYHHFLLEKGYKPDLDIDGKKYFSREFAARLPIEHCKPKFLEQKASEYLKQNKENSFILYVNFLEPHMPFFGPLDNLYNPEEVDLPRNFNEPLDESEPLRYRLKEKGYNKTYNSNDEKKMKELIARYWGLVTQVDMSVGKILDTLHETGLDENTIVVFTSDHGDMMGAHGLVTKTVNFDESSTVPFLMRVPQLGLTQKVIEAPVSQIDIVPTLLDLMDKKIDVSLEGKSLVPLMKDQVSNAGNVFVEWNVDNINDESKKHNCYDLASEEECNNVFSESSRMIVTPDGWKLTLSNKDKSTLFNLNSDPLETTNLFYNKNYSEVIDKLKVQIFDWQKKTGDTLKL